MSDETNWAGKTDVMIATPDWALGKFNPMVKLGEAQDMIDPVEQYYYHDVPGDRNGGPQGPPIERQILGLVMTVNLDLSRFDNAVLNTIKEHGVWGTPGTVLQQRVGTLILLRRSFRLVLINTRLDDQGAPVTSGYNFPCSVLAAPIRQPRGTKFTTLSLTMEGHRAPEGHWNEHIVYNSDLVDPA